MNNTDKLNASQYLVKQAMLAKLLAKATPYAEKAMEFGKQFASGAANPVNAGADMIGMAIPTSMGGRFAKFDPNVLARGLGGGALFGSIGGAGYAQGRRSGMHEGLDLGHRQGTAETSKKFTSGLLNKYKKERDQGYFGRLFDAVTNKGF